MDRGHLIARRFGGLGDASNIVPMDPRINRSYVETFENSLARQVEAGKQVYLRARVEYDSFGRAVVLHYDVYTDGPGARPRFLGTYSLDPRRQDLPLWSVAVPREAQSWWYDFEGTQRPKWTQ